MMTILLFILIVYGIANVLVHEIVFKKQVEAIKKIHPFLNKVLSCTTCLSFWLGMAVYLIIPFPITETLWLNVILAGIIGSGAINIIEHIKNIVI